MKRVFFDTNEGTHEKGYLLRLPSSLRDIRAIGAEVCEGMHVIIYMPEELEMEAVLKFSSEMECWLGVPIEGTIKYYDTSV